MNFKIAIGNYLGLENRGGTIPAPHLMIIAKLEYHNNDITVTITHDYMCAPQHA